jgi:hypothetical protein
MRHFFNRIQIAGMIAVTALAGALSAVEAAEPVTAQEAEEFAIAGYVYAFPLVLMDVSRQVMTNVEAPSPLGTGAPINQFAHAKAFPDASFTDVVRPNADTLYSSLWFDVTHEPLVVYVPDSGGRFYLLPMLDMWTDIFASPGKRTTGTGEQTFAIVGPHWHGTLPAGMAEYRSPTGQGWMIGRTQTNGQADYANVRKFQAGLAAVPLSQWGQNAPPLKGKVDPSIPRKAPVEQVLEMTGEMFFTRFAELLKQHPPHANDYPILAQLERLGIKRGESFQFSQAPPAVQAALSKAPASGFAKIKGYIATSDREVNHWKLIMNPVGTYGTDYLKRGLVAYMGLGANVVEDAIYPTALTDAQGVPFDSGKKYALQFPAGGWPPVRGFWSLTMYDQRQLFTANRLNRFAIGDRNPLQPKADGSLTLYIQRESPGPDKESNWLPAPAEGPFTMNLRLYWPGSSALDGTWAPPAVQPVP